MRKARRHCARALAEALEVRRLLASITVNGDQTGSANDTFAVNRSGNTGRIFVNGATSAAASWDTTVANSIGVSGLSGDDSLTIDYTFGDPIGTLSSFSFAGGSGNDALNVVGTMSADTVILTSGKITFNGKDLAYSGSESLALNLGIGADTITGNGDSSVTSGTGLMFNVAAGETMKLSSGTTLPTFSDISIAAGGTFDLSGINQTIDEISGAGSIIDTGAAARLTIGNNNGSSVFSGSLKDGTGKLSLTKNGAGRIELSGSNSFTGTTIINAGALRISNGNALGSIAGDTEIAGGTALGVLELSGGITTAESVVVSARNQDNTTLIIPPSIVSVSGANVLSAAVTGSNGGTGYTLRSDAGTMNLAGGIVRADPQSTYHRNFELRGEGNGIIASLNTPNVWGYNVWKMDGGAWTIGQHNTSGTTRVDAGTLIMDQLADGAVTVNGGTLATKSNALAGDPAGASTSSALTMAGSTSNPTGTIDINNNTFVIDYNSTSPRANLEAQIRAGYNNGTWTGSGITSSMARASVSSSVKTAIGVAEASDLFTTFPTQYAGQSVDSTSVVTSYTLAGDANLDHKVDTADFVQLSANFNSTSGRWFKGDFNYDGKINALDFNVLASNFGQTLSTAGNPWAPVPAADFSKISLSQFDDSELQYVDGLAYFSQLANAVVEDGPTRGFIDLPVWRNTVDNGPWNARVLENNIAFAFFYTTNRPWNPYHGSPEVKERLEAVLDYWSKMQNWDGQFSEYYATNYSLSPTAFGLTIMAASLEMLQNGPAIDPTIMQEVVNAEYKGIKAMLTLPSLVNFGQTFANQYSPVYSETLGFVQLYPQYSTELLGLLRNVEPIETTTHQSPAGFMYEDNGPDWQYTLNTEQLQIIKGWHLIRGTEFQQPLIDEFTRYYNFLNYNLLEEPDGSGYISNFGASTRTAGNYFPVGYQPFSPAEFIPQAQYLMNTAGEDAQNLASERASLATQWGNFPPMQVPGTTSYWPGWFEYLDRVDWRPTQAQRTASENMLPYIASSSFNRIAMDSRNPMIFEYVRRPTYYATFNSGKIVSSLQRFGMGALWSPQMGTVLQTQANTDTAGWGTRAAGASKFYEASSFTPTISINGAPISPTPGNADLPAGNLSIGYALGSAGSKSIAFDDTGMSVSVTHPGNFTEEFPLLLKPGEHVDVNANVVSLARGDAKLRITFNTAVPITVTPTSFTTDGRTVTEVVASASGSLSYRMTMSG